MALTTEQALGLMANSLNRLAMARELGQTAYGGDRDYYEVLGYPTNINVTDYVSRYERQDIAARVVDLPANDTWKKSPKLSENDDTDTPFTNAWEDLVQRLKIWNVLSRADRLSGIGRYGIIFIGLKDGGVPSEPVKPESLNSTKDVLFLRPFSENRATIKEWEKDTQSPRYGMPVLYTVKTRDDAEPIDIHYTRILHLADNKLDSEIYGIPRMRPIFNLLDDLMKIVGGTAEATWLGMRPGVAVSPQEGYDWDDTEAAKTQWLEEVQRYAHDPLRMLRLVGLNAEVIGASQVVDPKGPFDVTISLIAAATGIPQRVLTGSAAGELASAKEDMRQWAQFIANRQTNYAEPEILRPFIDALIQYGILPAPKGGLGDYDIGTMDPDGGWAWPSIIELSELERAQAVNDQSQAVKNLADPNTMELPVTLDERRELLGYPEAEEEEEEPIEDVSALSIAIKNFRAGRITADQLATFAIGVLADADSYLLGEHNPLGDESNES